MIFNLDTAMKLKEKYESELPLYTKMYDYYKGKTEIFTNYPNTERSNKVVNANYVKKFITEHVAYGVGSQITYTSMSDDEAVVRDIEYNTQIQKGSLDAILYKNMLIFGKCYEIAYIDNEELKFKVVNPLNSVAYCNNEDGVEMLLYFYRKELDDTLYINCYCDEGIYHFNEEFEEVEEFTPSYFGCVPVSVARLDEEENETIFNDIKTLQDAFENILSDWINNSADLRDAYLVLTGLDLDTDEAKKMKSSGIMQIPDSSGKAEFLIKNIPSDYIKNLADTLEDKIYQISQSINSNEAMQSNLSGVAILSRIINLRNRIGIEQKALGDAIRNRLKLLFIYLRQAYSKDYNYRDIKINFTMNVPSDDISMAQIISQLNGKLSAETGLNQLSFIQNGKAEYAKALKEQKQAMDDIDLDNIEGGLGD